MRKVEQFADGVTIIAEVLAPVFWLLSTKVVGPDVVDHLATQTHMSRDCMTLPPIANPLRPRSSIRSLKRLCTLSRSSDRPAHAPVSLHPRRTSP